jgi:hypothetical protein
MLHANKRFEDPEPTELGIHIKRNDTLYEMQKCLDKQEFKRKRAIKKQIESGEPTRETDKFFDAV